MLKLSDHKVRKNKAEAIEVKRNMHMIELMQQKAEDNVRENFFIPSYGKIGERKEKR